MTRDFADGDDGAALLAKLTDQDALRAVHPQRYLWPVIVSTSSEGRLDKRAELSGPGARR